MYEGTFSPDFKINGFCIQYLGTFNAIFVGWYKNSQKYGNWMSLSGENFSIIQQGWYDERGVRTGPMKDEGIYKKFTKGDIFLQCGEPEQNEENEHNDQNHKKKKYKLEDRIKFVDVGQMLE